MFQLFDVLSDETLRAQVKKVMTMWLKQEKTTDQEIWAETLILEQFLMMRPQELFEWIKEQDPKKDEEEANLEPSSILAQMRAGGNSFDQRIGEPKSKSAGVGEGHALIQSRSNTYSRQ